MVPRVRKGLGRGNSVHDFVVLARKDSSDNPNSMSVGRFEKAFPMRLQSS